MRPKVGATLACAAKCVPVDTGVRPFYDDAAHSLIDRASLRD
jgi:hypothetical protein